jgi:hypothetical protein
LLVVDEVLHIDVSVLVEHHWSDVCVLLSGEDLQGVCGDEGKTSGELESVVWGDVVLVGDEGSRTELDSDLTDLAVVTRVPSSVGGVVEPEGVSQVVVGVGESTLGICVGPSDVGVGSSQGSAVAEIHKRPGWEIDSSLQVDVLLIGSGGRAGWGVGI